MINDKLKDFKYFYNKLPLYLQQSEGFLSHFEYWFELLQGIDKSADDIESMINVFDEDYLTKNPNCSDFLDKIGLLYGVSRIMTVDGSRVELDDKLMLFVIKCQIIKNFFNGTFEQINKVYKDANLPIIYYTRGTMEVEIIFCAAEIPYTSAEINILYELFNNGFLIVKSMGVNYSVDKLDVNQVLYWADSNGSSVNYWDSRVWGV